MSGIYIPNMTEEMAKVHLVNFIYIPVPDHGRLIDADALSDMLENYKHEYALEAGDKKDFGIMQKAFGLHDAELMAESLPTIIPAEPFNNLSKPFKADKEDGE